MKKPAALAGFAALCLVLATCDGNGSGGSGGNTPPAPVAEFTAGPALSGNVPLEVTWEDQSSNAIDSWFWDFGDGQTSTLQDPVYEFTRNGVFTVTLIVIGPGGVDEMIKTDFVTVAPSANFSATPMVGAFPMPVDFTDTSQTDITSRTWDFGDGTVIVGNDPTPTHTYLAPGNYSVSLTVTGAGGADAHTAPAPIQVFDPVGDPSFELQVAGTPPAAPWAVTSGVEHVINPVGPATDNLAPSHGARWCEVSSDGTDDATPPSNPTPPGASPAKPGTTQPAVGGAGVSQTIRFPTGRPLLKFEAAFVAREIRPANFHDWMSVDVTDGTDTYNLYFRDTLSTLPGGGSAFQNVPSQKYAAPMTPVETASADLESLFPGSTTSTAFVLTIQAGNGADAGSPSSGYVDGFRFEPLQNVTAAFSGAQLSGTVTPSTLPPGTHTATFDDTTAPPETSRLWNFWDPASGSNTSALDQPQHVYSQVGLYTVTLRATNGSSYDIEAAPGMVTVATGPVADFTVTCASCPVATPADGPAGLQVTFTNNSSGATSYHWEFDEGLDFDGTLPPPHTFNGLGPHVITLTAFGEFGSFDDATQIVTVHTAPSVNLTVTDPTAPTALLSFNNSLNFAGNNVGGQVTTWTWEWDIVGGGGSRQTASGTNSHAYPLALDTTGVSVPTTRTARLTAVGPGGQSVDTDVLTLYPDFDMVEEIFDGVALLDDGIAGNSRCDNCHSGGTPDGGLLLTAGNAHSALVGVGSNDSNGCVSPNPLRVDNVNFNPNLSYLYIKVVPLSGCAIMPQGCSTGCLLDGHKDVIARWISGGAKNN